MKQILQKSALWAVVVEFVVVLAGPEAVGAGLVGAALWPAQPQWAGLALHYYWAVGWWHLGQVHLGHLWHPQVRSYCSLAQ